MIRPLWNEHFKDRLKNWVCPSGLDSTSLEALQLVLRDNFISNEEYLTWASRQYQLPILDDKFFDLNSPNELLWNKTKDIYPWGPYLMPISSWDSHLIVAGLAPAKDSPPELKIIYVLASNGCLLKRWTDYHGKPVESLRILKPILPSEIPNSIRFDQNEHHDGGSNNEFTFRDLNNYNEYSHTEDSDTEDVESSLDHDSDVNNEYNHHDENDQNGYDTVEKDSDEHQSSSDSDNDSEPIMNLNLMVSDTQLGQVKLTKLNSLETANENHSANKDSSILMENNEKPENIEYTFDYLHKNRPDEVKKLIMDVFDQMKANFQKAAFIAVSHDEIIGKVTHLGIESNTPVNHQFSIDLTTPSLFRTVAKTLKPYHGYVVLNEINERFFEEFFYGQIPDNVTLTPIVCENQLIGILMGCGEKSSYTKNVLLHQQKLSDFLSKDLSKNLMSEISVA